VCVRDLVGLELGIPSIGALVQAGSVKTIKRPGCAVCSLATGFAQTRSIASGHVHHGANILAVHDGQTIRRLHAEADPARIGAARGMGDVGVKIDQRKAGARNVRLRNVEHALRLISLQRQHGLRRLSGGRRGLRKSPAHESSQAGKHHELPAVHGSPFGRHECHTT
jgi:hypothetical protein